MDDLGNVLWRRDRRSGVNQSECFDYDALNRMIAAYTKARECGADRGPGVDAYDLTYTYASDGRILSSDDGSGPTTYSYPSSQAPAAVVPVTGDWDGDGTDTPGLYLPGTSTFIGRNDFATGPAEFTVTFGAAGSAPLVGDWDGNGTDTPAVVDAATMTFTARNTFTPGPADLTAVGYGAAGDIPIAGDWDGDGTDTIGYYRPSDQTFHARNSFAPGPDDLVTGSAGDPSYQPLVGDWNGDGTDTIGVFVPAYALWATADTFAVGTPYTITLYGAPGDLPVPGDWDGNGTDTPGGYRPSTETFRLRDSLTSGAPDHDPTFLTTAGPGPHAVTTVGTDIYAYDPNGQMTGRPGPNGQQALTWDPEHRLTAVDDGTTQTSFVYDPDGTRLIRSTGDETTLYIDGQEITATGTSLTTKRYYTLGNTVVAVRDSATGALTYLLGDHLASMTLAVNASTGATQTQRFLPYGAPRSGTISATDRGWIGQTKDASTGLQYLNARYYDPVIGRFTARDPLADLSVPATLDAYGYAGGTPVTAKDPTGLLCEGDNPCGRSRSSGKPVCTGACRPPGINYRVPPHSYNADGQEKSFTIGRHPGAGQVTIGLFISDASTGIGIKGFGLYGSGNDREASPWAHPSRHKFFAILDFEKGKGWAYVSPSCDPGGNKCDGASAFSTNFGKTADVLSRIPGVGKSNGLKVTEEAGLIEVRYSLRNSRYPSLSSTIDGEIELQAFDGDVSVIDVDRDNYPTLEIYRYEDYYSGTGAVETLAGAPQGNIWELMQLWPGGGS